MDKRTTFGRWLKMHRTAQRLTQRALGAQINYSAETIKKVEAGKLHPSDEFVRRVLLIFDIPPDSVDGRKLIVAARSDEEEDNEHVPEIVSEARTPHTETPTSLHEVALIPDPTGRTVLSSSVLARLIYLFEQARPSWWMHPTDPRYQRARKHMLDKVYTFWIKGVLENSLHGATLIELGLELRPEEIAFPWDMVLQQPGRADRLLPPQMTINEVFKEMSGALLILGLPGSGKTTMLLALARELLLAAMQNSMLPIPVVFNLSSWATKHQPIDIWLVEELSGKYHVPKPVGRAWVKGGEIVPLLDGLDEMQAADRASCVVAINHFRHNHGLEHIVVCSRLDDYVPLTTKLALHGAVVLQSLAAQHIDRYLASFGRELKPLRLALEHDSALQELASSPLMLSIITLAYRDKTTLSLSQYDIHERRSIVFATYIEHMLRHHSGKERYSPQQTVEWLSWLAQMMLKHGHTIFVAERMQPSWLPCVRYRWLHTCGESTSVALIAGVGTSIVYGLRSLLPGAPHGGLAYKVLAYSQFMHTFLGLPIVRLERTILWVVTLILSGLLVGVAAGLITSAIAGLTYSETALRLFPEHDRWLTARNMLYIFVAVGLVAGTVAALFVGLNGGLMEGLTTGAIASVAAELLARPGTIASVEELGWSWSRAFRGLVIAVPIVLAVLLVAKFTGGFEAALWYRLDARILVYGLVLWTVGGITSTESTIKVQVNQGLRKSAYNALIIGMLTLLTLGGLGELSRLFMPSTQSGGPISLSLHIASAIEFGLAGAIIAGLGYGGFFYLQQRILRLLLYASKCIPSNYTQFLDSNVKCAFLHKVGGGYVFIHRLLLEHFARMH